MRKPEFEIPDTVFAQAFLEAKSREDEKAKRISTREPPRNDRKNFPPELARGAVKDYERTRADLEAKQIAQEALELGGSWATFTVRKPTIHVTPPAVLDEAKRQRELPDKLKHTAEKLGRQWNSWINNPESRSDRWRNINPNLSCEWAVLIAALSENDLTVRVRALEGFVERAGIKRDEKIFVPQIFERKAKNLADYYETYMVRQGRIKRGNYLEAFRTGGVVAVWMEHLSGLSSNLDIRDSYRLGIENAVNSNNPDDNYIRVKQACTVFAELLDQPPVRDYFRERANSAPKP